MISFSRKITVFSFILTIFVIWIHAVNAGLCSLQLDELASINEVSDIDVQLLNSGMTAAAGSFGIKLCFSIQKILGTGLGQIAVPGFFAMSGYLFFKDADKAVDLAYFAKKWKRRISSLLIPFLLWNTIYYIIYVIIGKAGTDANSLFNGVILNRYNPVFWYLRELLVLTVLTPIIYILLKSKNAALSVLCLSFILAVFYDLLPYHIVNEDALFYYMTGAFASLNLKHNVETENAKWKKVFILTLIAFAIFDFICTICEGRLRMILSGTIGGRAAGYIMLFSLINLISSRTSKTSKASKESSDMNCENDKAGDVPAFMQFNFLIYALHYLEIRFFRLLFKAVGMGFIVTESIGFLLMPVFCTAVSVAVGIIMKRYIPKTYRILTGGRG